MTSMDEPHRHIRDKFALREVDGWNYHATNLSENADKVYTLNLDRPVGLKKRLDVMKDFTSLPHFPPPGFPLIERYLSPQQPYQASPLSYLNSFGRSWSLICENNVLEWAEFSTVGMRSGSLEFWFRNVVAGSTAIVSLDVTTGTTGADVTGTFEIGSSATSNHSIIPVMGFRDNLIDIVVQPSDSYAVLVEVTIGPGIEYFTFNSVTYQTS
jgi:hypothetical protein